ncbi:MAG: non-canonical purine NTP pyrophosphatase [Chloroflexota bacterium]
MTPSSLILATRNPAKLQRLRRVFEGLGFDLLDLPATNLTEPEEEGSTHRETAERKAAWWSAQLGGLAAASDGGADIPYLGATWDGLRTRRAAGPNATDMDRAHQLLNLMHQATSDERTIHWIEGLAIAENGRILAGWEQRDLFGTLVHDVDPKKIAGGFWVNGLVRSARFNRLVADLNETERAEAESAWARLRESVVTWHRSRPG